MILASGARGPGLNSRSSQNCAHKVCDNMTSHCVFHTQSVRIFSYLFFVRNRVAIFPSLVGEVPGLIPGAAPTGQEKGLRLLQP